MKKSELKKIIKQILVEESTSSETILDLSKYDKRFSTEDRTKAIGKVDDLMSKGYFKTKSEAKSANDYLNRSFWNLSNIVLTGKAKCIYYFFTIQK